MISSAFLNTVQIHGGGNGIGLNAYNRKLSPRLDRISRGRSQGSLDFTKYHDGQVFDLGGRILDYTGAQIETLIDQIRGVAWFDNTVTFKLQRNGIAVAEQAVVVVTDMQFPETPSNKYLQPFTLEMFSKDPRVYSQTLQTVSALAAAGVVNLTPNNGGDVDTPVTWTITGPVTNPKIVNSTSGYTITLAATLAAGHTLVIDTSARTVLLDGTTEHPEYVDAVNTFWYGLVAGANTVQLQGTGMTNGTTALQAQFRDARG